MPAVENATPESIISIKWDEFQLGMLGNPAYQRVSESSASQRAVSRVETYFTNEVENWPVAAMFWGAMIRSCPTGQGPTETEVDVWNQIATVCNMPITFTAEGYLTPNTED